MTPWRVPRRLAVAALSVGVVSCASHQSPVTAQLCVNPDAQLVEMVPPLVSGSCRDTGAAECDRLTQALQRLSAVCPAHVSTTLVNAVLAYQEQQPARAQQLLDEILARPQSQPDAAVLRARIAIEEGNLVFARRLLGQQLQLAPDHASLHETFAAALYVDGDLAAAVKELTVAGTLGAPRWRVAYHLGLIQEADGHEDEAIKLYEEALQGRPEFSAAASRLKALRARRIGSE